MACSPSRSLHPRIFRTAVFMAAILGFLIPASHALDKDVKAAAKAANEAFSKTSFVAKVDIRNYGHHYVLPDGSPAPQKSKKQGRGGEGALFAKKIKVRQGEVGEGMGIRAKKDEIIFGLTKKRRGMNGAWVHILFDRRVSPEDFEPAKLARAVSSLVVIRGYEPGADLAAAFEEAGAGNPEKPLAPTRPSAPVLKSFNVRVEPLRLPRGSETRLIFEYEIIAPEGAAVAVSESRSLLYRGALLPSFPTRERLSRTAGHYESTYSQPIPASAAAGFYEMQAEVCIGGDCISRQVILEVTP